MQRHRSKEPRVCPQCGITFAPKQLVEIHCSISCAVTRRNIQRGQQPKPIRQCRQCGADFPLKFSKDRKQFCSKSCATTFNEAAVHIPAEERFWSKVDKNGPIPAHCQELGPCWLWTAHRLESGYGHFALTPKKPVAAHRYAYELSHGAAPGELMVCHHCDNPPCVNPAHLFLGTAKDNTQDSINKGRSYVGNPSRDRAARHVPRGQETGNAKLTEEQVLEIRSRAGTVLNSQLAAEYGVSGGLIGHIIRGRAWKHLLSQG